MVYDQVSRSILILLILFSFLSTNKYDDQQTTYASDLSVCILCLSAAKLRSSKFTFLKYNQP